MLSLVGFRIHSESGVPAGPEELKMALEKAKKA